MQIVGDRNLAVLTGLRPDTRVTTNVKKATSITYTSETNPCQTAAQPQAAQSMHARLPLTIPMHAPPRKSQEALQRLKVRTASYFGQPPFGAKRTLRRLAVVLGLFCHMSPGVVLTSMWTSFTFAICTPSRLLSAARSFSCAVSRYGTHLQLGPV